MSDEVMAKLSEYSPAATRLRKLIEEMARALEEVCFADEDCRRHGLPGLPVVTRILIDTAIAKAEIELASCSASAALKTKMEPEP